VTNPIRTSKPAVYLSLFMLDASSITAELEALQQYEMYRPIARRLEGENLQIPEETSMEFDCVQLPPV
jgi:hypothetical protein